ncbi:multiple sugar transport system substrate-binding protein [Diaminobutyricimonas aerilata]|uniref:Multiple sugar transport system substrate-binding protein n=1 Tax=Diaminobutyricimonas aerilata TaxID=1162967 RepID=A0A2M9CN78_9MICO|nr:sugar ABC transporter substrate-binding protein [Diaminobutyricimonas aerilata]PJJ73351.1 multiple sugar transport system substrate-binding protein [Diaminobutyricimonas aerilata]
MTKRTLKRTLIPMLAATALALPLAACASGDGGGSSGGTVHWWTWDEKQAVSYKECLPGFEKENPGVKVEISQYAVDDYFTKLTAGFVAGNAPDAFQNSVQFFDAYAKQGQLEPLTDYIEKSGFDLDVYNVGVSAWQYTDGEQYALPLDWAATAFYYNVDKVAEAGLTPEDIATMTWNPDDGGTFDKVAARLTVDENGVRADEPGFDKTKVATYGVGALGSGDFIGQTTWNPMLSTTGWRIGDPEKWPTKFNYDDPEFVKTMEYLRGLTDRGIAPGFGQFTVGDTEQLGSGAIAMASGGSWSATTFAKLPGSKVGIAPTVLGPDGETRSMMSNSNGNQLWAGSKNKENAWKWMSYMGTEECQTKAALQSGSFFPSIPGAMDALAADQLGQGVDLSVFVEAAKNEWVYPAPAYANGSEMGSTMQPLFEAYFSHERDADVFAEMAEQSKEILAG